MAQNVDKSNIAKNKLEDKDILIISNVYRNTASAQSEPDNLQGWFFSLYLIHDNSLGLSKISDSNVDLNLHLDL